MKLKLSLILLLFFAVNAFSQDVQKVFDEVKNVTIRGIGPITKNNVIKGYYAFYEFDKADKKTTLFRLRLMDENLNDLGTKEITGPKEWELLSSGFDGNNFCFKFWDPKAKTIELKVYDQTAKEIAENSLEVNYKASNTDAQNFKQSVNSDLNILENNGFVDYTFNEPNNAFIIRYVDGTSKRSWNYTYEPEGKSKVMLPGYLNGNSEMILTSVSRIERGWNNMKTEQFVIANSTKNGSLLFELSTEFNDNHIVPVNAVFDKDKIIIVGLNYKSNKTYTTAPDGFAFLELDKHGKLLKSNFKNINESLGKYLSVDDNKLSGGYYMFIHNIVHTNKNTNLVIAEKFKKGTDAGGIATTALSAFSGRSVGSGAKLRLQNMVIIEFDMDGNPIQAKEIPKAEGITPGLPSYALLLPPYLLATLSNFEGWMDYRYTLKSDDNSDITFSFVDYDRLDANAEKTQNFGQIKYTNGKITTDKIAIKKESSTFSYLYPAKPNHVLQINYFKKEKKLTMDLIKLNN